MSWYVEALLLNKDLIRAKQDVDSDEFSDLLVVENAIDNCSKSKFLSDMEMKVLNYVLDLDLSIKEIRPNLDDDTVAKIFKRICNRIAFKLGDYFTDEGYLAYLSRKYELSEAQTQFMRTYMGSKFRHKLAHKLYEEE